MLRRKDRWQLTAVFGNEWALERALQKLAGEKNASYQVADRRTLTVRLRRKDEALRERVVDLIRAAYGHVEEEPLG